MKKKSQTYNIMLNSAVGIIASLVQIVLNYVVRIVIVKELGAEINGIHNLFQNLINVMMLIETGFSTALIVHLYKPIEEKDKNLILQVMTFYKKIYLVIGCAFFSICVFVNIFVIDSLITSSIALSQIRIYFMLFAFSFVANYFTCYKRGMLFAEQKNRISIVATLISEVTFRSLQIVSAVVWHQYSIMLILIIGEKLVSNIICNIYVNRHHPYLKETKNVVVSKNIKESIFNMVKPLFIYNVASTLQQSAKSIYISMFMGNVKIVGYVGNYQLIISAIQMLCSHFGGAYTSSFGNIAVNNDKDHMFYVYEKFAFFMDWIAIVMCAGILACAQDFIMFAFGKTYLLKISVIIILLIDMYVYLLNIPIISIQNALGLHHKDIKYMVIQAILALLFGYFGGKYCGMMGILLGLLIPQIVFTLINKGMIIYKNVFDKTGWSFLVFITKEIAKCILVTLISYFACIGIDTNSYFMNFLLKGCVTVIVCGLSFIALSFRNPYVKEYLDLIKRK